VVLGTATAASVSYPIALGAAMWAAYGEHWWLVALWSALGGVVFALSGRRWMRSYRGDPAAHARGESLAWLVLMVAAALGGLVMLVLNA
jgi:membrane protein implicated in regulation of membrane protease activity